MLVVEDEQAVGQLFGDLLRHWGCELELAVNGKEGVEKYKRFRPDLVLMDLEMPEMNGFDASQEIIELDPQASILLVTAFAETALARRALEQGLVKAVIPKPFELHQLKTAIQETVKEPKPQPLQEVRGKLAFALLAFSYKIDYNLEFTDEEARGLRDILRGILDDLHRIT